MCDCKEYKEFDRKFGGIQVAMSDWDKTRLSHIITKVEDARDVWGFKYCPYCGGKIV